MCASSLAMGRRAGTARRPVGLHVPQRNVRANGGRNVLTGAYRSRRFKTRQNIGLVGLGYWGPNILRVLFEQTDVNVPWICDLAQVLIDEAQQRSLGIY